MRVFNLIHQKDANRLGTPVVASTIEEARDELRRLFPETIIVGALDEKFMPLWPLDKNGEMIKPIGF